MMVNKLEKEIELNEKDFWFLRLKMFYLNAFKVKFTVDKILVMLLSFHESLGDFHSLLGDDEKPEVYEARKAMGNRMPKELIQIQAMIFY